MQNKRYEFFIVVLTKQGKLIDASVVAPSVSEALDKVIDRLDLAGNIVDYKFCIRRHT